MDCSKWILRRQTNFRLSYLFCIESGFRSGGTHFPLFSGCMQLCQVFDHFEELKRSKFNILATPCRRDLTTLKRNLGYIFFQPTGKHKIYNAICVCSWALSHVRQKKIADKWSDGSKFGRKIRRNPVEVISSRRDFGVDARTLRRGKRSRRRGWVGCGSCCCFT